MRPTKKRLTPERRAELLAQVRRDQAQREQSYRERALALFPHVCARCGREYSGKDLRELTVHHKDSNHRNNPPDGSNWELLCIYCHDDEHQNADKAGYTSAALQHADEDGGYTPFAGLQDLLGKKPDEA